MKKIAVLTICSINYIPKALVMLSSYKQHNPAHQLHLVLVDRKTSTISIENHDVNVVWAEDLGIPNFLQYAFMYDVIELNTNVKPYALKKILKNNDAVIYLDPDIKVYSAITPVIDKLKDASLVVTPHTNKPVIDGNKPDDLELLKFGGFNLGFIGVSNSIEGFDFLDWWSDRCLSLGFYEPQLGLAVDQKWLSIAPCFFQNMKVIHHIGLNVAFWNLHERTLNKADGNWMVNESTPLIFVHFSSFDSKHPENIAYKQDRYLPNSRVDFTEIAIEYAKEINQNEKMNLSNTPYSFDYFDNGTYITPALRRFYAVLKDKLFLNDINPFDAHGNVLKFASEQRLILKNNKPSKRHTFKDINKYGLQVKIIHKVLRLTLTIIGPERYFNLMRYIAHISSLRNQSDLFGKN